MSFLNRNCRDVVRLILERQERRLGLGERLAVRLHLGICRMCSRFQSQARLMERAMTRWKAYSDDKPS